MRCAGQEFPVYICRSTDSRSDGSDVSNGVMNVSNINNSYEHLR